jgi:hypothetical protein
MDARSVVDESVIMRTHELEKRSREDEVTYVKWRRGVLIFYTCVGLAAVGIGVAAHFAGN